MVARHISAQQMVPRDKKDGVAGSTIAQQYLRAGMLDEIQLGLAPVLLGARIRLFDNLGAEAIELASTKVVAAPGVTQLGFRVVKQTD